MVRRLDDKCTGTSCTLMMGYAEWLGEVPSLLPQMRRRSTLEEFHPECTGTSMRLFLLQRLRERDGGLVATRSRASPPTVDRLNSEKGEPQRLFGKQKLPTKTKTPTFTWQLRRSEKLKGAVTRASIARTDLRGQRRTIVYSFRCFSHLELPPPILLHHSALAGALSWRSGSSTIRTASTCHE